MRGVFRRRGQWGVRWEEPRGFDGKRRLRSKGCKGMTEREAELELIRIRAEQIPMPSLTIYGRNGCNVILGQKPDLAGRFDLAELETGPLVAGIGGVIRIREAVLPEDTIGLYLVESDGELLIWNICTQPAERCNAIRTIGDGLEQPRIQSEHFARNAWN